MNRPLSTFDVAQSIAPWRPHVETSPGGVSSLLLAPSGERTSGEGRNPSSGSVGVTNPKVVAVAPRKAETAGRDLQQTRLADELHTYLAMTVGPRRSAYLYRRLMNHIEAEVQIETSAQAGAEQAE